MAAIRIIQLLDDQGRAATADEQQVLARWSSWGAVPQVFDETRTDWVGQRAELRSLLDDTAWAQARRTTVNAHYTSPQTVQVMWRMLEGLGFAGGRVLEPGCGVGTFIGLAPASAEMTGVELDPTTARIAAALYPGAEVRAESFVDSPFPDGVFDAVIGNVPFADVRLHDRRHNPGSHSLHNHFIIKSLALTRPGGVVAVLTSSFTMDAQNPAARREMQQQADLVGAVRLPAGTHRRSAGTEAVTDLLVFRRRLPGEEARPFAWEQLADIEVEGKQARVNRYFVDHPDRVLGTFTLRNSMYGADQLSVATDDVAAVPARLGQVLDDVVAQARQAGLLMGPRSVDPAPAVARVEVADLWDGTLVHVGGEFFQAHGGQLLPFQVPATRTGELAALIGLRDGARALLEREATTGEASQELEADRAVLLAAYEGYVAAYGPVSRFKLVRGPMADVVDPVTGETVIDPASGKPKRIQQMVKRVPDVMRDFRSDPYAALVQALENFDEETGNHSPAMLLTGRVLTPRHQVRGADTPSDALAVCLDQLGRADLDVIAGLLGTSPDAARAQLGTLVFDDPSAGELIPGPEYLSGNVRQKLAAAQAAALADDRFRPNVEHLVGALPEPIPMEDIQARLGSVWISPQIHQQFLSRLLRDRTLIVENPLPGQWVVKGDRQSVLSNTEWGTLRRPAPDIAAAAMSQRQLIVMDKIDGPDGKPKEVINPVETEAAAVKMAALQERFADWVWEDPARAAELHRVYNERFNSLALRDYTKAGEYLSLPGLAASIRLQPHQRAAVARMISEPAVGLFHQVGAGKTLEMVVGVTELRRLGLIRKPVVVVPNHMLEQFSREWLQAYPRAAILVAGTQDVSAAHRRAFIARAATNDWDGIVMTQSAFKAIEVSHAFKAEYIEGEVATLRDSLGQARSSGNRLSVKILEKLVMKREEALKKALDIPHDPGLAFEAMGIDYVVVDEAHMYKNLATVSNIEGAAIGGSQQAIDLHMKLEWLRARHGLRVATLATATPLANSITEAHVMQRYLRPDLLADAGLTSFDGWAATFGQVTTELEVSVTGQPRLKARFQKFVNVPELLRMWHVFADVKTAEDLQLPVPALTARASDGQRTPETIVLEPSPELVAYLESIKERAEAVKDRRVEPWEDNMLAIATDGRKAALDMRMIDPGITVTGTVKLDAVAAQILAEWRRSREREYLDPATGGPSHIRGGLQLVFADLGTPSDDPARWSAYTELKRLLVEGGMNPSSVRFIHEARNDAEKARMFAAARAGHLSVLIGSTGKMGVGTNVQDRVTALHHVDCPWRPADLEQRDGRAIRRGNQNPEVSIFRDVGEESFDAYSWQTVARKQKFINQVMKGRLDSREIEDLGSDFDVTTALASGQPELMEKTLAESEYQSLRRQQIAHQRAQSNLIHTQSSVTDRIDQHRDVLARLEAAAARTVDVSGDRFAIVIGNQSYTKRADAAQALQAWVQANVNDWWRPFEQPRVFGSVGGHELVYTITSTPMKRGLSLHVALRDVPMSGSGFPVSDLLDAPAVGTIRAIENKTTAIGDHITKIHLSLAEDERTLADAAARIGKPFPKAAALDAAEQRLNRANAALAALTRSGNDNPDQAAQPRLTDALGRARDALETTRRPPSAADPDRGNSPGPRTGPHSPTRRPDHGRER